MSKGILGRKLGMGRLFTEEGKVVPVTMIEAGPCTVVQKKTADIDGYVAVQIGLGEKSEIRANKPAKGHHRKAGVKPARYLKELRMHNVDNYEVGQVLKADVFVPGDRVDVWGTSKGKGFAGTIKRHGFTRGPMTHGSHHHRRPGSAGAMGISKVFKGKKMPGRMGGERVAIQNLEIVRVDTDQNLLAVKGAVPGPRGSLVLIRETVKG